MEIGRPLGQKNRQQTDKKIGGMETKIMLGDHKKAYTKVEIVKTLGG